MSKTAVPDSLHQFAASVPPPDQIRDRLSQSQREAAFLRRLLKLSIAADRATQPSEKEVSHAQ